MKITEFEEKDRIEVIFLWKTCDLVKPHNDPAKDIERKMKVNPELFLVGLEDGKIIATAMGGYEGHRGWVNYLAVDPDYQKKGHGREIMEELEKRLLKLGCPKINLQVRYSNNKAALFYKAIGYGDDHVISFGKKLD